MVVLESLLLFMGLILFFSNPKNENIRWASLIGFFGGSGGLSVLLEINLHSPELKLLLHGLFSSLGHYWTPYAILIFGLLYSDTIKTANQKRLCKILFLIPIIIMYSRYQVYPEFIVNYAVLSVWVVPYVIVSNILLIYSAWQETRPAVKRQRILTCLLIVPTASFMLTNIMLEAVGVAGLWIYNSWIIGLQFLLFLYFLVKYGFLGIQIKFEKQRHDSTIKAVASGTALLNHTIKNELAKIDLLVNQLKDKVPSNESSYKDIDLVLNSTHRVLELSTRIQNRLNIMEIKESEFWISQVIDSAIHLLKHLINSEMNVIKKYEVDVKVFGDAVHIEETFLNIIKNAIEAMDGKGEIFIKVYKTRKYCCIEFIDNGKGIKKSELIHVLDPFYSTKGKAGNYGLGLTYCYNVMEKHGGNISIKSKINQGTTITLSLPTKRMIDTKTNRQSNSKHKEITTYGKNQSNDIGR